jgi:hypothetical protein
MILLCLEFKKLQISPTVCSVLHVVMKISRKNLNRKIFPLFIRTVDMVSLFTFYTVIIMLIGAGLAQAV